MAERTKVVVRQLPADLPEHVFWESVPGWINEAQSVVYREFVPGKRRSSRNKVDTASRAYIQFTSFAQVAAFNEAYDSHTFRNNKGAITNAKVEFSPYQKAFSAVSVPDHRQGSIEDDYDFQAFVGKLTSTQEEGPATLGVPVETPTTTPLIEFLRAQRKISLGAKGERRPRASTKYSEASKAANVPQRLTKPREVGPDKVLQQTPQTLPAAADRASQSTTKGNTRSKGKQKPAPSVASLAADVSSSPLPDADRQASTSGKKSTRSNKVLSQRKEATAQRAPAAVGKQAMRPALDAHVTRKPADRSAARETGSLHDPTHSHPPAPEDAANPATTEFKISANSASPARQTPRERRANDPRTSESADTAGARRRLGNALAGIGTSRGRGKRDPASSRATPAQVHFSE